MTDQELDQLRREKWRLNGAPLRTLDDAQRFIEAYTATAFGVLPKTEIDLLVFWLLIEAGVIDPNGPIYRTARALNITPAKARGILFQYQLRHVPQDQTDHEVLIALTTARRAGRKLTPSAPRSWR